MKSKKGFRLKRLSFLTPILFLALVTVLADQVLAAHIIDENFEGTGYEETWTEVLDSGCTLDEDASFSAIPLEIPHSAAGSDCLEALVSTDIDNDAYAYQTETGQNISYVRGYLYVDEEGLSDDQGFSTLGLYDSSDNPVARIQIEQSTGVLKMKYQYYSNSTLNTTDVLDIALDTWYRVEYQYDITNLDWEVKVDGISKASGSLVAATRTPDRMLIGIRDNTGTGSSTLYTDLVVWDDARWPTIYVPGDYTSIQTAINNADSGDVVQVTDTNTYSGCITMIDGVDLLSSAGAAATNKPTINCTSGGTSTVTFNGPISCKLDGFNITHTQRKGAGIFLDNTGDTELVTISNCSIHNITRGAGIRMDGDVVCTITGNTIDDCFEAGIATAVNPSGGVEDQLTSGSDVTITGNTIGDSTNPNGEAGIYLDGSGSNITVTIGGSGDDCNDISYNPKAGIRLEDIDQVSIDNNNIFNNSQAGILLIDVSTVSPHITNNTIYNHLNEAGINIGGASSLTIGGNNIIRNNGKAGVAFYMGGVTTRPGDPSSGLVTIGGNDFNSRNDIHHNAKAGIAVIDNVTGQITIKYNKIHENTKAGIGIFNECTVDITDNEIYTHTGAAGIFTGDWSGTLPTTGTGFYRTNGPAILTIKRNKVYRNRAGMRLDHASSTINNNLVYGNFRGGIRFSGNNVSPYAPFSASWGITEIMNNTVDDNGGYVGDPIYEDRGGGIVYDDINATHTYFYDRPVGATQNPITIKNNIVANNMEVGIKYCADNSEPDPDRSYNLFYKNKIEQLGLNPVTCDADPDGNCGKSCRCRTLGTCDAPGENCCPVVSWSYYLSPPPGSWATGEICGQDPLFVDPDNPVYSERDYTLQTGPPVSPAIGAGQGGVDMGAYGGTDPILW